MTSLTLLGKGESGRESANSLEFGVFAAKNLDSPNACLLISSPALIGWDSLVIAGPRTSQ